MNLELAPIAIIARGDDILARAGVHGHVEISAFRGNTGFNARAAGAWMRLRVELSPALAERFTAREIDAVIAHEAGHHALGHIKDRAVLQWCYLLAALAGGLHFAADLTEFAIAVAWFFIATRLICWPAQNWIYRWQEYEADKFAAEMGYSADFVSYLVKFSGPADDSGDAGRLHPSVRNRIRRLCTASAVAKSQQ